MFTARPDQRYLNAWIKRAGRQLAASGQLAQTAVLVSRCEGGTPAEWERKIRAILAGEEVPSLDLLTRVDSILAPMKGNHASESGMQRSLF